MTCFDFEDLLQEFCDSRHRELPVELAAHTAHCSACREMQARFQRLQDAAAVWRAASPTVALADIVLLCRQAERGMSASGLFTAKFRSVSDGQHHSSHQHSSLAGWTALFASALALVIAMGIGWRVSGIASFANRQSTSQVQVATKSAMRLEPSSTPAPTGDRQLDVLLHDARDAYAALASQAWQQVTTAEMLLPPADTAHPFSGEESTDGVSESFSRPLAPLGKELREAVDSWLQQVFSIQDSST